MTVKIGGFVTKKNPWKTNIFTMLHIGLYMKRQFVPNDYLWLLKKSRWTKRNFCLAGLLSSMYCKYGIKEPKIITRFQKGGFELFSIFVYA